MNKEEQRMAVYRMLSQMLKVYSELTNRSPGEAYEELVQLASDFFQRDLLICERNVIGSPMVDSLVFTKTPISSR